MSAIVDELWIFSKDGAPLIELFQNTKIDQTLLGGFFSAIKSFSNTLSKKGLKSFSLGDSNFFLTTCSHDHVMFVVKTGPNVKEKKIDKFFKIITQFFENMYEDSDIENWNGDLSFFASFKEKLDLYFKMSAL